MILVFVVVFGAFAALVALMGGLIALGNRREVNAKKGKPFCGCGHHRAMHDPGTNECHGDASDEIGAYRRCPCRQYVGPEPLPSYYAPEIEAGE